MTRKNLVIVFLTLVVLAISGWLCLGRTCFTTSSPGAKNANSNQKCMPQNEMKKMDQALSCKLTRPELQKRKATVIADLKNKQKDKQELTNGFAFQYEGSDEILDLLTEFIKSERQCCDFFSFAIRVENNYVVWLEITGPEGAKDFIQTELEM